MHSEAKTFIVGIHLVDIVDKATSGKGPNTQHSSALSSATQTSPTSSSSSRIVPPAPKPAKAPSTEAFLKDFTLVAEAAKRAQMAVLMRDIDGLKLS
ncbi:hypothetical protein N658DRAFT_505022 [Parathielavia hyrcaniae]|uniref:Uncharacterized protein n=1 Tax=Parathielavia hyrcaniae TaxID=113614 RepID=A0AAN6T3Z9_9PEZI|nr:hypothetical protein N658DRAFT_505022 [Parathielavia hyrcaniae]